MEFGVHLPQIGFDDRTWSLDGLIDYARTAERLGFDYLCANDHLLFSRPWLDGPTALAALVSHTSLALATTIALPVVRGPVALAKTLGAVDRLSDGRLVVGVGPGSSERDYDAVGVPFDERWARFDESIRTLRALWSPEEAFDGTFYSTEGVDLSPPPAQDGGPPIWVASWGSTTGLKRIARLGDGWLASGYNTTPGRFGDGWQLLRDELVAVGRDPGGFPNGIATMFIYATDDEAAASRVIEDRLAPTLGREPADLADRLLVGSPETCAERLAAYEAAGVQRTFLWPVDDERSQLQTFRDRVAPAVDGLAG